MDQANSKSNLIEDFFDSGLEESISPFLTPGSRHWGKNLTLKASSLAALFLLVAYIITFFTSSATSLCHLCLLITYFLAGIPSLIGALEDLAKLRINIDVLMTLAAFLSILIGNPAEGALLLVLFSFSEAMEDAVTTKAKSAINSLKRLSPPLAYVLQNDGSLIERSVKDIAVDTTILIKAGQIIPLDGKIIDGHSSVNLMHLTGESNPVIKTIGDDVPAGARNLDGTLTIIVTHTNSDSTLAKIIKLITQAQESKPKFQSFLDKITDRYALIIIILAFLFAALLPLVFSISYLGDAGSIYRSLAFLIAASPCALIIAIPIAYLSSISCCAKKGILLKGGIVLDALAKCRLIAFDKTGTLTVGQLQCMQVFGLSSLEQKHIEKAIALAAALEKHSTHPIGQAITDLAATHNLPIPELQQFKSIAGFGLEGAFQDQLIYIGNKEYIMPKISDVLEQKALEEIQTIENKGLSYTLLLHSHEVFLFTFQDTLKPNINLHLRNLKQQGLEIIMLTGDHQKSADMIAEQLDIKKYYANLRPEDKLAHIEQLAQTKHLIMVGDGINDAPALARANVGISMGKIGSATAIDASDIVLLKDNLELLSWLVKKARSTVRIVRQNLWIAAAAIIFATLPALLGMVPLWLAVILHEGGTVLVGLNALRLLKK